MNNYFTKQELLNKEDFEQKVDGTMKTLESFKVAKFVISVNKEPKFIFMRLFDYINMYEKVENVEDVTATVPHSITQSEHILLKIKSKFDFLKGLSNGEILQVVQNVRILNFKKGELIFDQSTYGEEVFFIISGKVNISVSNAKNAVKQKSAKRVTVAQLKNLDIFGEMAPITKEPRSARATALGPTNILSFNIRDNENISTMKAFSKLKHNFIHVLSSKLVEANAKLYSNGKS